MNILFFDATRQWTGGAYRGLLFSSELKRRGHGVVVGCLPGSDMSQRLASAGIPFFTIEPKSDINLFVVPEIVRMIRKHNIDILDIHSPKFYWIGLMAARLTGKPVMITRNVPFRKKGIKKRINSLLYGKFVDRVVSVSDKVKREMIEDYDLPGDQVEVIFDGLDLSKFEAQDSRKERAFDAPVKVGNVSRLVYGKGLECLLDAVPEIVRAIPNATFFIAGEGQIEGELKERASKLGIADKVAFTGFRNDIPQFLAEMDITVLPSPDEGMSMFALESMASAVPIVVTSGTGLVDIIANMENGVIVQKDDPKALAEGVIALLKSDYRAIGQKARALVREKFNTPHVIDQYEQLIASLIRRKR
jgi:L-malate glycosyltransferase